MTKKYKNKLVPYCLGLSLLVAGNAYAIDLGDTGIKFSGGAKVVAEQNLSSKYDFGKETGGRYFNKDEYFRLDATFEGEHNLGIWGDTKFIWNLYSSFYNTSKPASFAKEAFVGLKGKFGTVQAGKFYTLTDNNIGYGQTGGGVFKFANYSRNADDNTKVAHVESFKQAIQYTTPDTLVKGLTVGVLVAADPNANSKDAGKEDKAKNSKYPWGFDTLVKYTHADSGFTVLGTYAETYNLNSDGSLLKAENGNDQTTKSRYATSVVKLGYDKNNLKVTVGYSNLYAKGTSTSEDIDGSGNVVEDVYTDSFNWYALGLDVGYTMGKHVVSVGYETAPKAFESKNSKDEVTGHVALQQVSADYKYNFTDKFYVDFLVEHKFDTREGYKNGDKVKNGFIKGSETGLTTTLKYNF